MWMNINDTRVTLMWVKQRQNLEFGSEHSVNLPDGTQSHLHDNSFAKKKTFPFAF